MAVLIQGEWRDGTVASDRTGRRLRAEREKALNPKQGACILPTRRQEAIKPIEEGWVMEMASGREGVGLGISGLRASGQISPAACLEGGK